jgi:hypothetical protein
MLLLQVALKQSRLCALFKSEINSCPLRGRQPALIIGGHREIKKQNCSPLATLAAAVSGKTRCYGRMNGEKCQNKFLSSATRHPIFNVLARSRSFPPLSCRFIGECQEKMCIENDGCGVGWMECLKKKKSLE